MLEELADMWWKLEIEIEGSFNYYASESFAPCRFCPMRGECMNCGFFKKRNLEEVDEDGCDC